MYLHVGARSNLHFSVINHVQTITNVNSKPIFSTSQYFYALESSNKKRAIYNACDLWVRDNPIETCDTHRGFSWRALCGWNLISNQSNDGCWNFLIAKLQEFQSTLKVKIVQHVLTLNSSWNEIKVHKNFHWSCTMELALQWEMKTLETVIGGEGERKAINAFEESWNCFSFRLLCCS